MPFLAAAVFAAGCLLSVLVFTGRPTGWPTGDLEDYRRAALALLHGRDVQPERGIGPPFAALAFVPVALLGPIGARAVLTTLSTVAVVTCLALCVRTIRPQWTGRARWTAALLAGAAALLADPVYRTLSFGQVDLVLMALVLVDLLGTWTVAPRGTLVGLATAVRLTPGIFIVYLALARRTRAAVTAGAVLAVSVAVGYLLAPGSSRGYWGRLLHVQHTAGVPPTGDQSLHGAIARLTGGTGWLLWALAASITLVVGMWLATRASRVGADLLGVSLCAVTGLLAAPVSWRHRWVWALPVAVLLCARCVDLRAPERLAVAACWTGVFGLAPLWWAPAGHGIGPLAGGAYPLAGMVFLAGAPALTRAAGRTVRAGRGGLAGSAELPVTTTRVPNQLGSAAPGRAESGRGAGR